MADIGKNVRMARDLSITSWEIGAPEGGNTGHPYVHNECFSTAEHTL
jgi:hypothetical protein